MATYCITYGGYNDRTKQKEIAYRAIAHSAEEAISIINTWKTYGRRDKITVNEPTALKIQSIFRDGFGCYASGEPRPCSGGLRTTGCGAWDITFSTALGETIEEHERSAHEQQEKAKEERIRKSNEEREARIAIMNMERRGWYSVRMTFECYSPNRGRWIEREFVGTCIASSQADAYEKACADLRRRPMQLPGGDMALDFDFPDMANQYRFDALFLGVKTDDGYSVEKWEEWRKNGEI